MRGRGICRQFCSSFGVLFALVRPLSIHLSIHFTKPQNHPPIVSQLPKFGFPPQAMRSSTMAEHSFWLEAATTTCCACATCGQVCGSKASERRMCKTELVDKQKRAAQQD